MIRYLLDTNHLSPLVTVNHPLRSQVFAALQLGDSFSINAPILSEFLFGIGTLPRAGQNLHEWQNFRDQLGFYGIDATDAEGAAELRLSLRRVGWQLTLFDALIAVIAVRNDLVLLTTDRDFRQVPKLQQANWLASPAQALG